MQVHSLFDSFNYAVEGLIHTFRTQRNMKIHFTAAFLVLLSSLFLDISKLELLLLFAAITFVIAMELVNTAIEVVIDMISKEYSLQARIAKNIAAAAVLLAAVNAVVLGYLILLDEIRTFGLKLIQQLQQDPAHLTFINLGLLVIIILTLKARGGKGRPLQGGMPSGHSAIAFAVSTVIIILTQDIVVASLVLLLALLVAQSRLENQTHDLIEVITGALIGFLLTVIIFHFL